MKLTGRKKSLINIFTLYCLAASPFTVNSEVKDKAHRPTNIYLQQSVPEVPNDLTKIYYVDVEGKLAPLPFEKGITSLNIYAVARDDKTSEVKLNGSNAATVLKDHKPSFYLFVADDMSPPPHLLVRLTGNKSSRRFTVALIKGRQGYALLNEENVRLEYRILERLPVEAGKGRILFVNYMEAHPRQPLEAGEYAIVGDSLSDIAAFRIE